MQKQFITIIGKTVKRIAKLRGGGSALPGLVVEKIDPSFINKILDKLPMGVAVVSGTNGKTTTTKMITELLESQGLKVFTNKTGSNYTRGIIAAILDEVNNKGDLDADIAVLELDEAHAINFINKIPPKYCLLLNVMRDQLDRFGEIDYTASLLQKIAEATTDSVVLNREDPLIIKIKDSLFDKKVTFFGLSQKLLKTFQNEEEPSPKLSSTKKSIPADVILSDFSKNLVTFTLDGKNIKTGLKLNGIYNVYNAAAALAFVRTILGDKKDDAKLIKALSNVEPAFGRGETIITDETSIELVLVKNPSGFRLGLESFDASTHTTMIAVNDNYADGRDMSWLWDVDFSSLAQNGVTQVSGIRAYDMALRLQYDEVPIKHIDTNIKDALNQFLKIKPGHPKRIYCTYTAMLLIRRLLIKNNKSMVN